MAGYVPGGSAWGVRLILTFGMSGGAAPNTKIIDWLRFWLAAYVCLHHASYLLWQNPAFSEEILPFALAPRAEPGVLTSVLAGLSLFWEEAVHLFFIISGFCIHYRLAAQPGDVGHARFSASAYLKHRMLRIVPPCWAAIVMTWAVDSIGRSVFPGLYDQPFLANQTGRGWFHFVGNLLFLQQDTGPVKLYGSNVVLWSLHCEMMYYLVYPIVIAMASRARVKVWVWLGCFLASVGVLVVFPGNALPRAVREAHFWFGGALLAEVFLRHGWRAGWWAVVLGGVMVTHESFLRWIGVPPWIPERVLGITGKLVKLGGGELFFLGLLSVSQAGSVLGRLTGRFDFKMNPGYSLYLIHFPLLALVSSLWLGWRGPLPTSPWLGLAAASAVMVLSFGFYKLVEEPSVRLKSRV